ncbi:AraC family transcriptional regulator [Clostridium sp. ZS2-4]|uniref:AraC family transcriptional regulator n=1 Tax=Clostridium sp. ZS2-4 TaxID=2987703 RepID=UPI00227BC743|nr:AraC family transcriptional regulator [Clostridium sp. ZS2-4]MCY6355938.1 AraC family transcriptional regulator [Clostridium sp. ZS2-4]
MNKSILEIAVDFQYGSQEAFTRAFKSCFGMTPSKYRKQQENKINFLEKINFMDYEKKIQGELIMYKPEIICLDKCCIVGYEYKTNTNDEKYFNEIPKFYDDFGRNEYYMKIPNRIAPKFPFGISNNYQDDGGFTFVIGEAVKHPGEELESGFVNLETTEGKYAVFKASDSVSIAQNIWRYIYGIWLPNSNYDRRDGLDFERIDVCNSVYPDNMEIKIYIPIK